MAPIIRDWFLAQVISGIRNLRSWARPVLIVAIIVGLGNVSGGDDRQSQYYAGLRSRRLFRIAEEDCLRRLADERITPAQRAELTIELSKSFAAHAAFALGDEQTELWSRAAAVLDEFLMAAPAVRFQALLATQRAMVPAARGAQLRWQSELMPLDETTRKLAETTLRDALEHLRPLPDDLDETLRTSLTRARSEPDGQEDPAPFLVHQLSRTVEFATAVAALDLAKVLPVGVDRTAALHNADRRFDALTRIASPDGMAWLSRIHRLDILRLREPADRVAGPVTSFLKSDPPPAIRDAAAAVLVRSYLDENRPDEALATLEEHREQHGLEAEELQALVVETLLAARHLARDKGDAVLAAELLKRSEQIDARITGPWKTLTSIRIAEAHEEDRYGPALARLVSGANWAWKNGDTDDAITAFGRAASQAHQEQQTDLAVELAMTAASIQVNSGRFEDAARSLGDILRAYPAAKQSAEADLLRIYTLGRLYQQQPSQERHETYRAALEQHRTSFADSPTAVEATWMLARLKEHEQQWEPALELFLSIPPESSRRLPAMVRAAAIFEQVLQEQRLQDLPTKDWDQRAEETLSEVVETFPPAPTRLTPEQAQVAAIFARILLHRIPPRFVVADVLLARVIDSGRVIERDNGSLDASWQAVVATASQWRVISLTGQGRVTDARTMLDEVQARQPERLLDILDGLAEIAAEIGIEHSRDIGRMQLQLAERLKSRQLPLSESEQRRLDLALAQAQVAIGQWRTAANLYEELLWKQPRDQDILEALATLYEECGSSGCLRQAVTHWQALQALQRKGTLDWLESRYHMAWCSHRLGEEEDARKLIAVTQVLYPQLGSPSLKAQFEALSQEVAAGTQK